MHAGHNDVCKQPGFCMIVVHSQVIFHCVDGASKIIPSNLRLDQRSRAMSIVISDRQWWQSLGWSKQQSLYSAISAALIEILYSMIVMLCADIARKGSVSVSEQRAGTFESRNVLERM